jgi:aryl-alcohol dehydrogenase-like predicted oxidoreductase
MSNNLRIVDEFNHLAAKKGCTSSQLALSWVIAQGAIPISGTGNVDCLEENCGATHVELNKEELAELRKLVNDAKPKGNRWPKFVMSKMGQ